jgi:hypothetical protein
MSRKDQLEVIAEFQAEHDAVNYLDRLPTRTAAWVALNVAKSEADRWKIEKRDMIRQGDLRPEYRITPEEAQWLEAEYSRALIDTHIYERSPSADAEQQMLKFFFADLPPDVSARAAYKVAVWAVHKAIRRYGHSPNVFIL